MNRRRFVLLDRDGTIIVEKHYLSDPDAVQLLPEAAEGLRRMKELGFGLVVITNQSGIGRGLLDEARLSGIHARMNALLEKEGVVLDGIFHCPHLPEDQCPCRKPDRGLADDAARALEFNTAESFVIGDKECDIDLGRRLGAKTLLTLTGYGTQTQARGVAKPDFVVNDLKQAAIKIENLFQQERIKI